MKRYHFLIIIGLLLLTLFPNSLRAQQSKPEYVNLFEYGKPITDEQVNFENFLINFSSCIKNANDFDFLETTYVGKIKNKKQARKLVRQNIHHGAPAWTVTAAYKPGDITSFFMLETNQLIDSTQVNITEPVNTIVNNYIHKGDAIYKVKIVDPNLRTLDYYVFIDSETKQVITTGNMLAIKVPVEFIKEKTNY